MAVSKLNPSSGGIPYGDTAGRPTASLGKLYGNGETARIEIYTGNGWQNIVQETPGVASASGYYYESNNSGTFTISGTNFVSGAIAYAVGTNGTEYQATTTTYNSLVQLTALFENLSPAYEPYDIKVVNPSNLFGLLPDAFYINDNPVWGTTAGSLGSYELGSVSIQLSVTDDESNSLTYALVSGTLPTGLSLSSSGLISGTLSSNPGTYSFTVSVSDGINTPQSRAFSIAVPTSIVSGGTLSSDSTYYYRTFTGNGSLVVSSANLEADVLVIAGGGGGGSGDSGGGMGGGGAGGVYYAASQILSKTSHSVVVGAGGNGGTFPNGANTSQSGSNSQFGSLTQAVGGGYGNSSYTNGTDPGGNGGSGGGGSGSSARVGGLGGSATSGQGYPGGTGGNSNPNGGDGYKGGGGGGAGARGQHYSEASTYVSCAGGAGTNSYATWLSAITPQMTGVSGWGAATSTGYIAGGGSGSSIWSGWSFAITGAVGGIGGGGAGGTVGNAQGQVQNGFNGVENTGSGGGAATYQASLGGSGAKGLVVVRYKKTAVGG